MAPMVTIVTRFTNVSLGLCQTLTENSKSFVKMWEKNMMMMSVKAGKHERGGKMRDR